MYIFFSQLTQQFQPISDTASAPVQQVNRFKVLFITEKNVHEIFKNLIYILNRVFCVLYLHNMSFVLQQMRISNNLGLRRPNTLEKNNDKLVSYQFVN